MDLLLNNTIDKFKLAKFLYWQGWRIIDIAERISEKPGTVSAWKKRQGWDDAACVNRIENVAEIRLSHLMLKEKKSNADYKEIQALTRQLERFARIHKYLDEGNEIDLNPKLKNRYNKIKNYLDDDQINQLEQAFLDSIFKYQATWHNNRHHRTREILKSRQIGATWYFAREAVVDAYKTGRNKIFLSASKAQAFIFKNYMTQFVLAVTGVKLEGNPIKLPNGAELYFLGSQSKTAQGYHGDFYFDEFFWTTNFEELNKLASGMALHKKWRKTYFSTPSSKSHQAYPFWTGDKFATKKGITIDLSHNRLKDGVLCEDKVWRQIVTIYDAEAGGCDLFDIDDLKEYEYTDDQFKNLLLCEFMDDTNSVFAFELLQRCAVDSWEIWEDFKPHLLRPFGQKKVWLGYDPSLTGDNAGLVVIAPPEVPGGKFRVLEKASYKGMDYAQQADLIKHMTKKYVVEHIAIDTTGIGSAVCELVRKFYPSVTSLQYSLDLKNRMVLKAQHVMRNGRLEFDAGDTDIAQSFLNIKKTITSSGQHATYNAGRTQATGHSDLAWAIMNVLIYEPLDGSKAHSNNIMEISV